MSHRAIMRGVNVLLEELEKQDKLLNQIKDIINRPDNSDIASTLEYSNRYIEIENLIKEWENEK